MTVRPLLRGRLEIPHVGRERADVLDQLDRATRVVDRFGAGEAFLAITSLCAALRLPLEFLAFLGNVGGAEAVGVVGNSAFLEETSFRRHIESLFK